MGLLLLVLGIGKKDGMDIGVQHENFDLQIDVKVVSAGTVVFLSGAIMAATAGTLKNKYQGSTIPNYQTIEDEQSEKAAETEKLRVATHEKSLSDFKKCDSIAGNSEEKHSCFYQSFIDLSLIHI